MLGRFDLVSTHDVNVICLSLTIPACEAAKRQLRTFTSIVYSSCRDELNQHLEPPSQVIYSGTTMTRYITVDCVHTHSFTINLLIFQNLVHELSTACVNSVSVFERFERANTSLSPDFDEESFWKCCIVDCNDGLMWNNFLRHFHKPAVILFERVAWWLSYEKKFYDDQKRHKISRFYTSFDCVPSHDSTSTFTKDNKRKTSVLWKV